ncbi:MAG TPA: OadG-related small transporter subunit [Oscillospiraceae bacterium]|nr:OadG-related small transporter subunit [Oscillospiraceae bacterium]HPF55056.1 OadG-related small transporter subunit [Clostridiales bacterium]HPK34873.1 OadG-related small transporter subunit [Oscillospiraceae bacterium]HPR76163.1 OadG-related small transporter subunit [Oscillospiraceae bacterium]
MQNLDIALKIMGLGMLGIFVIVGVIIFLTWLLKKLFPAKEQ